MKHTKGPWEVDGEGVVMKQARETAQRHRIGIVKNKADGALIAAAPELLKVCSNTLIQLKDLGKLTPDQIGLIDQIEESLKYVITKAGGDK